MFRLTAWFKMLVLGFELHLTQLFMLNVFSFFKKLKSKMQSMNAIQATMAAAGYNWSKVDSTPCVSLVISGTFWSQTHSTSSTAFVRISSKNCLDFSISFKKPTRRNKIFLVIGETLFNNWSWLIGNQHLSSPSF